jgi:hypothetical protein
MVFYVFGLVSILSGNINRNLVVIGAHEADIPGPQIEANRDSGRKRRFEMGLARFGGHDFGVSLTFPGCEQGCCRASDHSQGVQNVRKMGPHGHTSLSYWRIRDGARKGS